MEQNREFAPLPAVLFKAKLEAQGAVILVEMID